MSDTAGSWFAVVWADRDYHDLVRARQPVSGDGGGDHTGDVDFPSAHVPWEVPLQGEEMRIGRSGAPTGSRDRAPEIDLVGPPRDPGISHRHAVLLALPGERWVVIDTGSTNGTTVNYAEEPLAPDSPWALRPGDRIHLGAWTTVTVDRR